MFKKIRITALLIALMFLVYQTYFRQLQLLGWEETIDVVIYPVPGDDGLNTRKYIHSLSDSDFRDIEAFMASQARKYRIDLEQPIKVRLGSMITDRPPTPPQSRDVFNSILFSLKFRFWAFIHTDFIRSADIQLIAVYFDPELNQEVPDSLALPKGRLALIHVFADDAMKETNNFVINHEMLHTLGATDKYDIETNAPHYPEGYAKPFQSNRYQQDKAEIMGGRIPVGRKNFVMPDSLRDSVIGVFTALEINWFK